MSDLLSVMAAGRHGPFAAVVTFYAYGASVAKPCLEMGDLLPEMTAGRHGTFAAVVTFCTYGVSVTKPDG